MINFNPSLFLARFAGLAIIGLYYFALVVDLSQTLNLNNFFSNTMASDFVYLNILLSEDFIPSRSGINFASIPFLLDRFFISLFGFEHLWVMNIVYKFIAFSVLIIGIEKLLNANKKEVFLISITLAIFFCIDFPPFADRYPRPQFSNIFFFGIFIYNLYLIKKDIISFKGIYFLLYGLAYGCLAISNPWSAAVLIYMSLYALLRHYLLNKLPISLILYSVLGFSIILIPLLINLITSSTTDHNEYLGFKTIYEPSKFLLDYYSFAINDKYIAFLFLFLLMINLFFYNTKDIGITIVTFLLLPLPFILVEKTVQSYHLIFSLRDFLILICITNTCFFITQNRFEIFKFEYNNFNYAAFIFINILTISLVVLYGNSWVDRTKNLSTEINNYEKIYKYLNNVGPDCKVISNDYYVNEVLSHLIGYETFPLNGFIRNSNINEALDEAKISINLLSKLGSVEKQTIDYIIKLATHNYYSTTRSTIAQSLYLNDYSEDYVDINNNINSMQPWPLSIPEKLYQDIKYTNDLKEEDFISNKFLIIYVNQNKQLIQFKTLNYCYKS